MDTLPVQARIDADADVIYVGRGEVNPATAVLTLDFGEARELAEQLRNLLSQFDGGAQ